MRLPRERIASRLNRPFSHLPEASDFGYVMIDPLRKVRRFPPVAQTRKPQRERLQSLTSQRGSGHVWLVPAG